MERKQQRQWCAIGEVLVTCPYIVLTQLSEGGVKAQYVQPYLGSHDGKKAQI